MTQYIFGPMGLKHTYGSGTPQIPEPVLHTFSSERLAALGIPAGTPFYEETTYWESLVDYSGRRLADERHRRPDNLRRRDRVRKAAVAAVARAQVGPNLVGFGHPQPGCSACHLNTTAHNFGLAVGLQGPWITGNKFYAGSGAIVGYLPAGKIAVAVIATYQPSAFDSQGNMTDAGPAILATLSKALAPQNPIPQA